MLDSIECRQWQKSPVYLLSSTLVLCRAMARTLAHISDIPRRRPGAEWTITITQPSLAGASTHTEHKVMEDEEESARVLGLGVGLFLIILTWSLALAAALLMARTAAGSGVTIVTIATLVTLLLLVIPRQVASV